MAVADQSGRGAAGQGDRAVEPPVVAGPQGPVGWGGGGCGEDVGDAEVAEGALVGGVDRHELGSPVEADVDHALVGVRAGEHHPHGAAVGPGRQHRLAHPEHDVVVGGGIGTAFDAQGGPGVDGHPVGELGAHHRTEGHAHRAGGARAHPRGRQDRGGRHRERGRGATAAGGPGHPAEATGVAVPAPGRGAGWRGVVATRPAGDHGGVPRAVCCSDKLRGTLSGRAASDAVAAVLRAAGWTADVAPVSDGGEGFLDCFPGRERRVVVDGPLGVPVEARWLAPTTTPTASARR